MPARLKPLPASSLPPELTTLPTHLLPGGEPAKQQDSRTAFPFRGGETAALGRGKYFVSEKHGQQLNIFLPIIELT